ncbi:MAG: twitching motility protein PilT [Acidobacteria bacterium]|nr:twitching motility protein PilT [Acidobacteriota bacterium]
MAGEIHLRLYEELNDFLPACKKKVRFSCPLDSIRTVKELLKSLGAPEKDVELVLVNGVSVDLSCLLQDGDYVSIYPVFESLDIRPLLRVRRWPLRRIRFITGAGLLRLTGYLRLLGFETCHARSLSLDTAVRLTDEKRRILLTRDSSLLKYPELSRIYLVQAARPKDQLLEVLSRFDLFDAVYFSGSQPMLNRILKPRAVSK